METAPAAMYVLSASSDAPVWANARARALGTARDELPVVDGRPVAEVLAAVLPLVIVLTFVPPEQRDPLARLLAACDSSRRLRFWPALRVAVRARRHERQRPEPDRNTPPAFGHARGHDLPINRSRGRDPAYDRSAVRRP
jgi:hypothetical protein